MQKKKQLRKTNKELRRTIEAQAERIKRLLEKANGRD